MRSGTDPAIPARIGTTKSARTCRASYKKCANRVGLPPGGSGP